VVYGLNIDTPYESYFSIEPLDGDFSKVKLVDDSFDGGDIPAALSAGRPVKPEHVPTRGKWTGGRRKVPDFDNCFCVNVSEAAHALIERFEPDTHQFLPFDCFNGKGELLERRWYLIICNRIDSLDYDLTTCVLQTIHVLPEYQTPGREWMRSWTSVSDMVDRGQLDQIPPHLPHDTRSIFVFSKTKVGGRHLWRDKFMAYGGPWLSDELADALKASGLTGLDLDAAHAETSP
jgi:hypothetical protein